MANVTILENLIQKIKLPKSYTEKSGSIADYKAIQERFGLEQILFTNIAKMPDGYRGTIADGTEVDLEIWQVAELISRNTYKQKRAVFVGKVKTLSDHQPKSSKATGFPGDLLFSPGINVRVVPSLKEIYLSQTDPDDWALISYADLSDWFIFFNGVALGPRDNLSNEQRFNNFGITGCLTIYKSMLSRASFEINDGGCEDSLNIISSSGNIDNLNINSAHADALDMDFSSIEIGALSVKGAGNDCYDVSGGEYLLRKAELKDCGDKGISVGEASTSTDRISRNDRRYYRGLIKRLL